MLHSGIHDGPERRIDTREVWVQAVDLDNGGSFNDFPPELLDALLDDVLAGWDRRWKAGESIAGFVLVPSDRTRTFTVGPQEAPLITLQGTAAQLAAWAMGRPHRSVSTIERGNVPLPRTWI
ncbi:hypothetical protein [Amycolatopsis sp. DSM 110486]|uniref:hypothetical protein n=1 Tax=Amycolatopsis sp. DSM 110486 TaxID=2865832 RepID=UPI001C69B1C4|nr:hypothetical protein [Amycolatopsis sp. DSM 110486]QYN26655.1 hypothetical protein K1T34_42490 [Amycolatopsis sp. DSM 110486]